MILALPLVLALLSTSGSGRRLEPTHLSRLRKMGSTRTWIWASLILQFLRRRVGCRLARAAEPRNRANDHGPNDNPSEYGPPSALYRRRKRGRLDVQGAPTSDQPIRPRHHPANTPGQTFVSLPDWIRSTKTFYSSFFRTASSQLHRCVPRHPRSRPWAGITGRGTATSSDVP